ncbi:MAG: hypothetical protein SGJ24_14085 [Chloroflexota bacterium]|nr:hypothetical protein [Chloroflexota bacterium]
MSEILVLTLPARTSVLEAIDLLKNDRTVTIKHSAVLAKAEDGEVVVLEDDLSPNEGAIAGGTLGAMIGSVGIAGLGALLLPGVGALIAIGAGALIGGLIGGTTGGVVAGLLDLGLDQHQIDALAHKLNDGAVALVVEVDGTPDALTHLRTMLAPYNAEPLPLRAS